jgi:aspartate aminotransferase
VLGALGEIPGVVCPRPEGAFYVFPDVSASSGRTAPDGRALDSSEALCLYLLEACDVALVPGEAFGDAAGLRISYAASMEDLREAMRRIRDGIAALGG